MPKHWWRDRACTWFRHIRLTIQCCNSHKFNRTLIYKVNIDSASEWKATDRADNDESLAFDINNNNNKAALYCGRCVAWRHYEWLSAASFAWQRCPTSAGSVTAQRQTKCHCCPFNMFFGLSGINLEALGLVDAWLQKTEVRCQGNSFALYI